MSTIVRIILTFMAFLALMLAPAVALADDSQLFQACNANKAAANSPICASKGTTKDPALHIINVATNIVAVLAGLIAVIMIIISGITLISSGGSQEAVAEARKRLLAAVIGLVIVALAWEIITFLTGRFIKT